MDELFFNVVVLGCLQTPLGKVWRKTEYDMVIIECTDTIHDSVSLKRTTQVLENICKSLVQIIESGKEVYRLVVLSLVHDSLSPRWQVSKFE